jgi:hypothetical protein
MAHRIDGPMRWKEEVEEGEKVLLLTLNMSFKYISIKVIEYDSCISMCIYVYICGGAIYNGVAYKWCDCIKSALRLKVEKMFAGI